MANSSSAKWLGFLWYVSIMASAAPLLPFSCHGQGDNGNRSSTLYTDELNAVPTIFDDALLRALAQPSPEEFTLTPYSIVALHLPDGIQKITLSSRVLPATSLIAFAAPHSRAASSSAQAPPSAVPTAWIPQAAPTPLFADEDRENKTSIHPRILYFAAGKISKCLGAHSADTP
jgi:hypothetical protein